MNTGEEISKLTASDAAPSDWFGFSAAISDERAIVGARQGDDLVRNSGTAFLFATGEPSSDLTGDGFVDFDDLAVLLANWDQDVGASLGNLVDRTNTFIDFDDRDALLDDWTGPGSVSSSSAALIAQAVPEPSSLIIAVIGFI